MKRKKRKAEKAYIPSSNNSEWSGKSVPSFVSPFFPDL